MGTAPARSIQRVIQGVAALLALALAACTAPQYYDAVDRAALQARETKTDASARKTSPAAPTQRPIPSVPPPPEPPMADKVVVFKAERELRLVNEGEVFARYRIALGGNPVGHKRREGDQRTPEGHYTLDWRTKDSDYYRSIHISYPAPRDRRLAAAKGVDPGDSIMIHGLPPKYAWMGEHHANADWTDGCIAVSNAEIDRIWRRVPNGTPIVIHP
jgi:lipoprotein-anchoring transpeptidase ErfK/SrfK